MKWQLFISTFFLIFLAELGDKTQLATMARAHGGKWMVFLGASLALVCSTLIAVLVGDALARLIPQRVIDLTGGILFLIFGGLMIMKGIHGEKTVEEKAEIHPPHVSSSLAKTVILLAEKLESIAAEDYRLLAQQTSQKDIQECFLKLAESEQNHLQHLRDAYQHGIHQPQNYSQELHPKMIPSEHSISHDVSTHLHENVDQNILHAIEHEEATAAFYEMLARHALIPSVKEALLWLAQDEKEHVRHLQNLLKSSCS